MIDSEVAGAGGPSRRDTIMSALVVVAGGTFFFVGVTFLNFEFAVTSCISCC